MPTVEAIVGNKIAPGLLDRYLGDTGYDSQQTDEPEDPNRPNNLWEPVPGDHGSHGTFDSRAHAKSYELWASLNRPWIAALAGGIIASGTCYLAFRSWNGNRTLKGKAVRILRRAA
jgi:hypothetical protein